MEPGVIAIATIMAVGGFIAALAMITHVLEWRITSRIAKTKQEKADLEKAAQSASDCKSPVRSTAPAASKKDVSNAGSENEKTQSVVSPGYAPLKSPTSPMRTMSPSVSFGEILIITSPKMPTAPELVHSPISTCSMPSPVTPYTPLTPYMTSPTFATRPLLLSGSASSFSRPQDISPARYAKHDPYTHLAPRVMGSRIHRYASPPRHLRVTIPDRNTKPFERSHRRLPSDIVITAPPRVLARSISELVGDDCHDSEPPAGYSSPQSMQVIREVRATENNVREVGNFGW